MEPASIHKYDTMTSLSEKIDTHPEIVGGAPKIAGTRFTVAQIVVWHEYMGMSVDEIAHLYSLEVASIHAALAYYFDHQQEIRQALEAETALVRELKTRFPSKLSQAAIQR